MNATVKIQKNIITLKFGRLKSDDLQSNKAKKLVKKYDSLTPYSLESRKILVSLIKLNSEKLILNEFNDNLMSKKEAINYVMSYENRISKQYQNN